MGVAAASSRPLRTGASVGPNPDVRPPCHRIEPGRSRASCCLHRSAQAAAAADGRRLGTAVSLRSFGRRRQDRRRWRRRRPPTTRTGLGGGRWNL
ncbi:unnamed protein product [Lampetra fluviatilis]